MKKRILIVAALVVVAVVGVYLVHRFGARQAGPSFSSPSIKGDSSRLKQTQVVATLDEPMEAGKNVIWCSSFQAAWKALQNDLAKEPVSLEGGGNVVQLLNQANDPKPDAPPGSLYTAAGWEDKGIIAQIHKDLKQQFPAKELPTFPGMIPGSFVAYGYLEANVGFRLPYFQNKKPLEFTAGNGEKANVCSFGLRPEDDYAYRKLREQAAILYYAWDKSDFANGTLKLDECVLDLDQTSGPSQVVLARVKPQKTLKATLSSFDAKIRSFKGGASPMGVNDVLLVPDVFYNISHHFAELERRNFSNAALKGQRMDIAQQDILFRLDRNGAELKSEAKQYMAPMAKYYVFDRPFLIIMKKRGAERPYFVMWVDNAELLRGMEASAKQ